MVEKFYKKNAKKSNFSMQMDFCKKSNEGLELTFPSVIKVMIMDTILFIQLTIQPAPAHEGAPNPPLAAIESILLLALVLLYS